MKTVELDLEKDEKLESLSGLIRDKNIKLGEEMFNLRLFVSHSLGDTMMQAFLLLTKYLSKLIEETKANKKDIVYFDKISETIYLFYFKNFDTNKLEYKIQKDFKLKIELGKKNPLNEVFGIWKHENITLEQIRDKAWQRDN